jgi:aspartate kinase
VSDIVVMKFGGTSVADAARIKRAAARIVARRERGAQVVGVLSARGKTTDELIAMAEEVSANPDRREMDMLLSTGERISCALCAMAIHDLGHRAISLTGSQAGIVTDEWHTQARIIDVRVDRVMEALAEDHIVLVAGFQGVSTASADVTTLGRGGSDTTAVAVAAALGAEECEIYTDVAGVFSADPRVVPDARKLEYVAFEEMLELSTAGAGVLQSRSVEYARKHGVRIHCRSSFDEDPGTYVVSEGEIMSKFGEQALVTGVTYSTAESMITLQGVLDEPGVAARLFEALTDAQVKVDMIDQSGASPGERTATIRLTVPHEDFGEATRVLEPMSGELYEHMVIEPEMGKVSIVGSGMRTEPGVASRVFRVLADEGINIRMISTSPVRISCMVLRAHVEQAVRSLHRAFGLAGEDAIVKEDPFATGGF